MTTVRCTKIDTACLLQWMQTFTMMEFSLREYCDSDYTVVREVYATGFREHATSIFVTVLQRIWVQLFLLATFLGLLELSGSPLCATLGVSGLLLVLRVSVQCLLEQGVRLGLSEDLQDIQASYMQPGQVARFWVAEAGGCIVGTVAILPCLEEKGAWELKRITVLKRCRGRGIAKALCHTALGFVASRGVERVVLFTSMAQVDAHRLYHSLGFRKEREFVWPSWPARLVNFLVYKYSYAVDGSTE
ncbi:probable N-acetyltransferase CML5 [Engraulis encrasicolus]|uniref:probable N-acetyltransferase CML5 n=1 Tax=Engraulis encrasicolus TaxID=184585 RepID=UPI002FD25F5B